MRPSCSRTRNWMLTGRSMNEALMEARTSAVLDAEGALVDADMGAYYTWLNLTRLTGADQGSFLVWFEGRTQALLISPKTARGVESQDKVDLNQLIDLAR